MRRFFVSCLLIATVAFDWFTPFVARADTRFFDRPDAGLSWGGTFQPAAMVSDPALYSRAGVCETLPCQESSFDVDLPAGVWEGGPGGVQIAVDWFPREENDLDLYVFGPEGALVGRSDGVMASTGEAVRLRAAKNGRYRIVVVPRLVQATMAYRGLVAVEREPPRRPLRPLLPNVVSLRPRHVELRTGAYFVDHEVPGTPSCYPEEVTEKGARRCLRFDQIIGNVGEGPVELRYRMDGLATDQQVQQRVYSSDGTYTDYVVDHYEFHPAHAHFHYKNFGQAFLYRVDPQGSLTKVRESRKNGFCMIDVENLRFNRTIAGERSGTAGPRTYYFPRCNTPAERDATGTAMVNGISPGWADVYNWFLADQYIEISGLPDGEYVLETVANPARTVHEATFDDNNARVLVRIHGDAVRLEDD